MIYIAILIAALTLYIVLNILLFDKIIKYKDNIQTSDIPKQEIITDENEKKYLLKKGFTIKPKYKYKILGRVLSKRKYDVYDEIARKNLSNWDIAIGWNEMTKQSNIDNVDVTQNHRWYMWKTKEQKMVNIVEKNSANVHIIHKEQYMTDYIKNNINIGDFVEINGYLVDVSNENGYWKTSTSRDDTGAGSCEIIYTTSIKKIEY